MKMCAVILESDFCHVSQQANDTELVQKRLICLQVRLYLATIEHVCMLLCETLFDDFVMTSRGRTEARGSKMGKFVIYAKTK